MKKITLVVHHTNWDNWEGLYVDGQLLMEDSRLTLPEVLSILFSVDVETIKAGEWMDDRHFLPDTLEEFYERQSGRL